MEYRILGPFEVRAGGQLVELGGAKPRALLAILLLHRNEVVSADRLIDELWGESPPTTAIRTLHGYVSRLRKALNGNGALMASARDAGSRSGDGDACNARARLRVAGRAGGAGPRAVQRAG